MTDTNAFVLSPEQEKITSQDKDVLTCQFPSCDNSVTKPARGRTPKFCDEHKAAKTTGTRSTRSWSKSAEIESILSTYVAGIGTGLALINEVDGHVIAYGGPAIVHELVELAKTDTKLRKYLVWLASPGKYAPLAMAVMAVVLPILANHDLLPKLLVNLSGVTKEK